MVSFRATAGVVASSDDSVCTPSFTYPLAQLRTVSLPNRDGNLNAGDTTEQTFYSEWMLVNGSAVGQRGTAGSRSELFSAYNTTLDADRSVLPATDHALMLAQTDLEYEVTRVKSPVLGRDLKRMGRGDGAYYANGGNAMGGSVRVGSAKPSYVGEFACGIGNSMNTATVSGPGIGGAGGGPGGGSGGAGGGGCGGGGGASGGGGGGGGGSTACDDPPSDCGILGNYMLGPECCGRIGSDCVIFPCKTPGFRPQMQSCFNSCTVTQCEERRDKIRDEGGAFSWCYNSGVFIGDKPVVAVYAMSHCPPVVEPPTPVADCLCAGMCLWDCGVPGCKEDCDEPIVPRGIEIRDCDPIQEGLLWKAYHTMCRWLFKKCRVNECLSGVDAEIVNCLKSFCKGERRLKVKCISPSLDFLWWLVCLRTGTGGFVGPGGDQVIYICPGAFPCSVFSTKNGFHLDCCQVVLMEEMVHLCMGDWRWERPEKPAKAIVLKCYEDAGQCGFLGY